MGKVIVIASGKGGVGKTTVTANIGVSLARHGKKVVLIDADMGLRNLDMALHLENDVVYDIRDVLDGVCNIKKAVVVCKEYPNMVFLPASQSRGCINFNEEKLCELCRCLSSEFDFVLIDSPAGIDKGFSYVAKACDWAIVVVHPLICSIRDADRTIESFEKYGVSDIRLVINEVNTEYIRQGIMMNIDEVIDLLGIKLLGIVPFSIEIIRSSITDEKDESGVAFSNIAMRIEGKDVPIFNPDKEKKKINFFSIFKRKH